MGTTYSQILRSRILTLCADRKISVNELAHRSNLPQSTIDNFIQGTVSCPTLKTIHKIANGLGLTPAEFLDTPEINNYMFSNVRKKKKSMEREKEAST